MKHNGMSFFPATIPSGVKLFHGSPSDNDPVEGMEWLAFEKSFAYVYTGVPRNSDCYDFGESDSTFSKVREKHFLYDHQQQRIISDPADCPPVDYIPGYMQTYTTTRSLNFLYIDGVSGGKSDRGTQDTQDIILLNRTSRAEFLTDDERARSLCKLARDEWKGRIDGFVRANFGFELILCEFRGAVTLTDSIQGERGGYGLPYVSKSTALMTVFDMYKSIEDQFWGLGGNRIGVDFERMVTAYAVEGVDLWVNGTENQPRLTGMGYDKKSEMRRKLSEMIIERNITDSSGERTFRKAAADEVTAVDWQAIVDVIVLHYSARLYDYAYGDDSFLSTPSLMLANLNLLIRNFINQNSRNTEEEINRCTHTFIPFAYRPTVAATAVIQVSKQVCTALLQAEALLSSPTHLKSSVVPQTTVGSSEHQASHPSQLQHFRMLFQTLIDDLAWPAHKYCRGCSSSEVCFTAAYPFGTRDDLEKPSCKNLVETARRLAAGYWVSVPGAVVKTRSLF